MADGYASIGYATEVADGPASMQGIVSAVDQLRAARFDLFEAWQVFCTGPLPANAPTPNGNPTADRLEYSVQTLHSEISALRGLAEQIRSRA